MTELLRVFNCFYSQKEEYCVICLRSGKERRMMNFKSLQSFVQSINLPFSYPDDKFQRICFVCERQAAAAHRFRLALNLSASVHNLFTLMARSRRSYDDVERQIHGRKEPTGVVRHVPEWEARLRGVRARSLLLQTEVLMVNSLLGAENTQSLHQGCGNAGPHVVLGGAPGELGVLEELGGGGSPPGGCADVYVIPDAPPAPPLRPPSPASLPHTRENILQTLDVLSEPEIYMDSIVMIDEDMDPIEIKHEEPASNEITIDETRINTLPLPPKITQPTQPLQSSPLIVPLEALTENQNTYKFLLHPIVENNGVVSVPSLSAQIIHGQLVTVDKSNLVIQTPKLALHNGVNFNLVTDPTQVTNVLKSMSNTDLSTVAIVSDDVPMQTLGNAGQNGAVQIVQSHDQNVQNSPMLYSQLANSGQNAANTQYSLLNALITPSQTYKQSNVVQNNNMQTISMDKIFTNNEISSIVIDDDEGASELIVTSGKSVQRKSETESVKRRKEGDDKQSKKERATKSRKETDWEDKIPMDVISFIDATDPNAPSVLAPELSPGIISNVHSVTEEGEMHSPGEPRSQEEQEQSASEKSPEKGEQYAMVKPPMIRKPPTRGNAARWNVQSLGEPAGETESTRENVQPTVQAVENSHQNVFSVKSVQKSLLRPKTRLAARAAAATQASAKKKGVSGADASGDVIDLC